MRTFDDSEAVAFLTRMTREHQRAMQRAERAQQRIDPFFAGTWTGAGGSYGGAALDRTTEAWNPGTIGPNRLHQMGGRTLRERARDLVENNPYAAAAVDAYVANVIECGIIPKPKFDDAGRRKLWSDAWEQWGGLTASAPSSADVTGIDSIYELQRLWLTEVIVAGGCLLHFVELPRGPERQLPLAIELIPEERIADDRDTFAFPVPRGSKTQNPIVRGVEIEQATGRPVAYWVKPSEPNDAQPEELQPIRMPADQCVYGYFRKRANQYRGLTLLKAVLMWLWRLGYYVDNEMIASNVKSSFGAMIKTAEDGDFDYPGLNDDESCATDVYGNLLEKLQPGMIWRGRPGDEVVGVGPNNPAGDSIPWIRLIEQSIAIGMGLSPAELTRNYADINFSAARAAMQQDRKRYRPMQRFVVTKNCNPTWQRFTTAATRVGLEGFPRPSEFIDDRAAWLAVTWRAPGWESVNPLDDARANEINVLKLRTRSRSQIIGDEGGDSDEKFDEIDREEQKLDDLGILEPVGATSEIPDEPAQPQPAKKPAKRGAAR